MEGIELGFGYAPVAIRVKILEGRRTTSATGTARSFHTFRSGAEFTTGRRSLAEIALATFTAALHSVAFGAAVKITTGRRSLAEVTVATFTATLHSVAFGAAVKITAGRRSLAVAAIATFTTTRRAVSVTVAIELATGRRTLAEASFAPFTAALHAMAFRSGAEFTTGRRSLAEVTIATFAATGRRTVAFTVTVKFTAGRGALAITPITTLGTAIFRSGKFCATVAAAGPFGVPPHFRARARRSFRSRPFLSPDHAAETNQAQSAETASEECRCPDTVLLKNSFAAHLDILLAVRRAVSCVLGFDSGGPAPIGRLIRPSSCPTVAAQHNGSRHGYITSS